MSNNMLILDWCVGIICRYHINAWSMCLTNTVIHCYGRHFFCILFFMVWHIDILRDAAPLELFSICKFCTVIYNCFLLCIILSDASDFVQVFPGNNIVIVKSILSVRHEKNNCAKLQANGMYSFRDLGMS